MQPVIRIYHLLLEVTHHRLCNYWHQNWLLSCDSGRKMLTQEQKISAASPSRRILLGTGLKPMWNVFLKDCLEAIIPLTDRAKISPSSWSYPTIFLIQTHWLEGITRWWLTLGFNTIFTHFYWVMCFSGKEIENVNTSFCKFNITPKERWDGSGSCWR